MQKDPDMKWNKMVSPGDSLTVHSDNQHAIIRSKYAVCSKPFLRTRIKWMNDPCVKLLDERDVTFGPDFFHVNANPSDRVEGGC